MGIRDRAAFCLTLRSTLVKEGADIETFEELFPLYFGTDAPPLLNPQAELTPEEMEMLQEALEGFAGDLEELLNWLLSGQGPSQEELDELANDAGMQDADSPYQSRWYARRMQRLLGWDKLPQLLELLWEWLAEQGMDPQTIAELKAQVGENQEDISRGSWSSSPDRKIQDNMVDQYEERRDTVHDLMQRPFEGLSETEMDVLRDQVRRLAARLRSRAALRQKRGKQGKLDAKGTIRASLKYGGVPLELTMKRRATKPRIVVILDVSTSMRPVAEFFLRLMYELGDQVQNSHSFAFIDHLEDVTDDMKTLRPEAAINTVLDKLPRGYYSTDLGRSLVQFVDDHLSTVDQRTTVIVLGDGRNNYRDPRIDAFDDIKRRSRRLIWMNPEYPRQWHTGDSDMHLYAPLCDDVHTVRNLQQLTDAIDAILG